MFFSQSKPNIDSVIPAMDYIDQQLSASSLNPRYSASIKASITLRKKTLNQYYNMTNHSEIYRIAMGKLLVIFHSHVVSHLDLIAVLHPHHKLDYFKKAGWEEEWIITAKEIVRDEFERSYMAPVIEDDEPSASEDRKSVV